MGRVFICNCSGKECYFCCFVLVYLVIINVVLELLSLMDVNMI